jgi:hypothetical protein
VSDYVKARWVGYPAESPIFGPLVPGETICDIPAFEARTSDHWEIVEKPALPKSKSAPSEE